MEMFDVRKYLVQAGVRPSLVGLDYLTDEVLSAAKTKKENGTFRRLHADVAQKYNTTPGAVERGIRNALRSAMDNNPDFIADIGLSDCHGAGKYTLSDCVYAVVYLLQEAEANNLNLRHANEMICCDDC